MCVCVCFHRCLSPRVAVSREGEGYDRKLLVYSKYAFVFAFENSEAKNYITEKFWNPFLAGAVPVYLGAPGAVVEKMSPSKDAYVDVREFTSAAALGAYLTRTAANKTAMAAFQAWRKRPRDTWNPLFRAAYERDDDGDDARTTSTTDDDYDVAWMRRFCKHMCSGLALSAPPSHRHHGEGCRYPPVFGKPSMEGPPAVDW